MRALITIFPACNNISRFLRCLLHRKSSYDATTTKWKRPWTQRYVFCRINGACTSRLRRWWQFLRPQQNLEIGTCLSDELISSMLSTLYRTCYDSLCRQLGFDNARPGQRCRLRNRGLETSTIASNENEIPRTSKSDTNSALVLFRP